MPPSQVANAVASRTSGALSGATVAATLTNVVGSGNAVYGGCSWDASVVSAITSVVDDKANSYTVLDNTLDSTNGQRAAQFYCKNITNGPKTVTVTFAGGSPGARTIVLAEFSGVDTADQSNDGHGGQNQQNVGTTANAVTSGAITTTLDGDLIVGISANTSGLPGPPNVGTGFTLGDADNTSPGSCADIRLEWLVQATHGSQAATFTNTSGTQDFTSLVAALKAASSGTNVNLVAATGSGAAHSPVPSIATALGAGTSSGAQAALALGLSKTLASGTALGAVVAMSPSLTKVFAIAAAVASAQSAVPNVSSSLVAGSGSGTAGSFSTALQAFLSAVSGSGVAAAGVPANSTILAAIAATAASEGLLPQLGFTLSSASATGSDAAFSPAISKSLSASSASGAAVALQASFAVVFNLIAVSATTGDAALTPSIAITLADIVAAGAAGTISANLGGFVNLVAAAALTQPAALRPAITAMLTAATGSGHATAVSPALGLLVAVAAASGAARGFTPSAAFDIGSVAASGRAAPIGPTVTINLGALAAQSSVASVLIELFFGLTGVGGLAGVEAITPQGSVVNVPLSAVQAIAAAAGFTVVITFTGRVILIDDSLNASGAIGDTLAVNSDATNDLLGASFGNDDEIVP